MNEIKFASWTLDEIEVLLSHIEGNEPAIFAPALRAHGLVHDDDWLFHARLRGHQFLVLLVVDICDRLAAAQFAKRAAEFASVHHIPRIMDLKTEQVRVGATVLAVSRRAAEHKALKQVGDGEQLIGFE